MSDKYKHLRSLIKEDLLSTSSVSIKDIMSNTIFYNNFIRLMSQKVNIDSDKEITLAGLSLVAVVTDNAVKESQERDDKFRKIFTYLYKYLTINNNNISELQTEMSRSQNLTYSIKLKNQSLKTLKTMIYSAGGFAYEIAFAKLLRIDTSGEFNSPTNMNRIAPLYSYYIASLSDDSVSTTKTLVDSITSLLASGNNLRLFTMFRSAVSYKSLINDLYANINKSPFINYVTSIKNKISEALNDTNPEYSLHKSSIGIFDIIATSKTKKHIKFDVKTTVTVSGITEPTGKQIHKWGEETSDTLFFGIVSIIVNRINWNLPYLLEPNNIKGGAISNAAIENDLENLRDPSKQLNFFTRSKDQQDKTIGIFKIPTTTYQDFNEFKLNGESSEDTNRISSIAKKLNDDQHILPKSNIKQLSRKMVALYEKLRDAYPDVLEKEIITSDGGNWRISFDDRKKSTIDQLNLDKDLKDLLKLLIELGQTISQNKDILFSKHKRNKDTGEEELESQGIFLRKNYNMVKKGKQNYAHSFIGDLIDKITSDFESETKPNGSDESNSSDEAISHETLTSNPFGSDEVSYDEIISKSFESLDDDQSRAINEVMSYIHKIYYLLFEKEIPEEDNIIRSIFRENYSKKDKVLLERSLRSLVRMLLEESDKKKSYSGSHPEESYGWSAKEEDFMFDKPGLTTWEEDRKWVKQYLKSMGLLAKK